MDFAREMIGFLSFFVKRRVLFSILIRMKAHNILKNTQHASFTGGFGDFEV